MKHNPKKTFQQMTDEKAVTSRRAVGADQPGGQDRFDMPRLPLPKGGNEDDGTPNRPNLGGIEYKGD